MEFMTSYKRLDNLCRDINGVGITGYIEDMEHTTNGIYHVSGWKHDYYQLKHYRYIRNKISHENYADEATMCSVEDSKWIDEFYQRIIDQSDPLAVFQKSLQPQTTTHITASSPINHCQNISHIPNKQKRFTSSVGYILLVLTIVAVTVIGLCLWLSKQ